MPGPGAATRTSLQTIFRLLAAVVGCGVLLAFAPPARSEAQPEYRLKAAFLYNFAAFTEWPSDVGPTLNLCVFGPDPFSAEIDALDGKSAGARKIEVQAKPSLATLKDCQIVFVASAALAQMPRVTDALRGLPALIIADSPGALALGAMLNMNLSQGRVSFEANLLAARQARLILSSRLLRLATEVIQ